MGIVIEGLFEHQHSCVECLCANGPKYTPMLMSGSMSALHKLCQIELASTADVVLARLDLSCRCLWEELGDSTTCYKNLWEAADALLKMEPNGPRAAALQEEVRQALRRCEQEGFEHCQQKYCPVAKRMREADGEE